ncbi:HD domain-containing phosphohydrolase [Paraburkholderia dioscoreae]|uniref:HD-GYP domain-containing protein n=1 Tax=Paraburkholderia dioscoreae TaxID=2604047 RepID=A0A5Q4ZEN6_9BURK|nr:HD domain-containing phosphohydrolase [Paraburkholderia dioscoreae]VVD27978.1 HD-GYP domain-containing protein [Paraburkholderia dioscoreae]
MHDISAIRVLDAVKALAFIGDLSMGQPTDHSPRTGWLAARLAAEAGLDGAQCDVVREVSLLRWSGCTANATGFSDWLGDDIGGRAAMLAMRPDWAGVGESPAQVGAAIMPLAQIHCEVSGEVAHMLGLADATQEALRRIFESWDGGGFPGQMPGGDVPSAVFMVAVAGDLEILSRVYGLERAQMLIAQKAGRQYPAELARLAAVRGAAWLEELDRSVAQRRDEPICTDAMQLVSAPEIVADVIDLKLPWMTGYSRRVAGTAAACCASLGTDEEARRRAYVAGLLHGMGRMAVPNAIWNTAGGLSPAAWEKVRLVPYWTARAGKQIEGLARESEIASFAYERLDGSGYFRSSAGDAIGREARILAVAAAWVALRSARPWRPAFSPDEAAALLTEQARAGRFDAEVVKATVSAELGDCRASVEDDRARSPKTGLLSPREAEVLKHISLGASNKEVARALELSPSTVRTHVESVFRKLECSTRAAATLKASALGYI